MVPTRSLILLWKKGNEVISQNNKRSQIMDTAKELKGLACKYDYHAVEAAVSKIQNRLNTHTFYITVAGEFANGKTTLVNSLLRTTELPTSAEANSSRILEIHYGKEKRLFLVDQNKNRKPSEWENLSEIVTDATADKFRLEVHYPCELCQDGVILVDTPGLQDINRRRVDLTYEYLPKTDALVFVLDATNGIRESEYQFLGETIGKSILSKVIIVCNKIDLLPSKEEAEVFIRKTEQDIENILKVKVPVFGISSLNALKGIIKDNNNLIDKSGFSDFQHYLKHFIENERYDALLKSGNISLKMQCGALQNQLITLKEGFFWNDETYREKVNDIKKQMETADELIKKEEVDFTVGLEREKQIFCSDFKSWLSDTFVNLFVRNLRKVDIERLGPEKIQEALEKPISLELEERLADFLQIVAGLVESYSENVRKHLNKTQKKLATDILSYTDIESPAYAKIPSAAIVGIVAFVSYQFMGFIQFFLMAVGTGMITGFNLQPIVEAMDRKKKDLMINKIEKELREKIFLITQKIDEEMENIIEGIRSDISQCISEARETSLNSFSLTLDELSKERRATEAEIQEKKEDISQDLKRLGICDERISAFVSELCAGDRQ